MKLVAEFSEELTGLIDKIAKDLNTSREDVLQRAISLYRFVIEEGVNRRCKCCGSILNTGKQLSVTDPDRKKIYTNVLL